MIGCCNPMESAKIAYTTSGAGTRNIVDAIKKKVEFSLLDHNVVMSEAMANMHTTLQQQDEVILHSILAKCKNKMSSTTGSRGQDIIMVKSSAYC